MREQAPLPGGSERADRAAVPARGEPAGVAVRQRARAGHEELGGVRRHRAAALDLLRVQAAGVPRRRFVTHLRQRPGEVDRRRPRRGKRARRSVEVLPPRARERQSVRSRDPDRGRAANRKLANRSDKLRHGRAFELDRLVRKTALVEENDLRAVLLVPNDVLGF